MLPRLIMHEAETSKRQGWVGARVTRASADLMVPHANVGCL